MYTQQHDNSDSVSGGRIVNRVHIEKWVSFFSLSFANSWKAKLFVCILTRVIQMIKINTSDLKIQFNGQHSCFETQSVL